MGFTENFVIIIIIFFTGISFVLVLCFSSCRLEEQSGEIPTRTVFLENQWRVLENMKAQYVAVNGIRKVSCVVSTVSVNKPVKN